MLASALLLLTVQDPQAAPPQPMPVPRTVARHLGSRKIRIDGGLDDWPALPPIDLTDTRMLSGTALGAWRGRDDLEGVAFLAWTDEDLFLAARLRDDWHRPVDSKGPALSDIPLADSILWSFDPRRDTRALGADRGREEDRELWVGDVDGSARVVLWDRYRATARAPQNAAVAMTRDPRDRTTTYELRIPWSEILPHGMRPEQGMTIHLQIVLNDFDEPTDPMPQTRIGWTFGTAPMVDPGVFGSVVLIGDVDEIRSLPDEPEPPKLPPDSVPPGSYWVDLLQRLQRHPPAVVTADGGASSEAGGAQRLAALRMLDHEIAVFPRIDFLELQHRVHRRMRRESAGIAARGLPYFWQLALAEVARKAAAEIAPERLRLCRLPQGGFLVRTAACTFGIDVSGHDVETQLVGGLEFALHSSPLDVAKRNDQLLLRLGAAKRALFSHLPIHLPGVDASKVKGTQIGESYSAGGLKVGVLGARTEQGDVCTTVAHRVEWADGTVLLHVPRGVFPDWVRQAGPVDILILSAREPEALAIAAAVEARLVVLDDVLCCHPLASDGPRVDLDQALALQSRLRPRPSLLLAPGDCIELPMRQ